MKIVNPASYYCLHEQVTRQDELDAAYSKGARRESGPKNRNKLDLERVGDQGYRAFYGWVVGSRGLFIPSRCFPA